MIVMLGAQKRGFHKFVLIAFTDYLHRFLRRTSWFNRFRRFTLSTGRTRRRTRMQNGKHKYKKLEVMQQRITEYKSELLTREQIIPDPPNEVLQNNDKGEGRGDELKTIAVLLISFP